MLSGKQEFSILQVEFCNGIVHLFKRNVCLAQGSVKLVLAEKLMAIRLT